MSTILVKCKNEDCDRTFRIDEFKWNSSVKNNPDKQECLICKNTKIMNGVKNSSKLTGEKKPPKPKLYNTASKQVAAAKNNGTKKAKKKRPRIQNIDKALDNAWAILIKLIAGGKCEYCGSRRTLNSHHVFTRTNKAIRWRTINGICLCAFHHTLSNKFSAHGTPTIFTEWVLKYRGEEWHDKLRMMANSPGKFHKFEKEIMLKELNNEIKSYE